MLEMKVILALTVRGFSVEPVYAEFDKVVGQIPKTFNGERAYLVLLGSAKPVDGSPCWVQKKKQQPQSSYTTSSLAHDEAVKHLLA